MGGQPVDALDVEMVRRLVEQQDVVGPIGRAGQQRGERDPPPLPAGQFPDRGREPTDGGGVEPAEEAREHVPDAGVRGPHVVGDVPDDGRPHVRRRVEVVGLAEHAEGDPARPRHPPRVGRLPARQHAQQGALAVAVAADDAHPVAVVEAEADAVQQGAPRERDGDPLGPQQVRHQRLPS